jgi:hypothetical protein
MPSPQQLRDLYRFPGFAPWARIQDIADDPQAVLLTLRRRQKKRGAACVARASLASMTKGHAGSVTLRVAISGSICPSRFVALPVGGVAA